MNILSPSSGKTITRNLTAAQAKVYQRAIDNHRALTEIVAELRALSRAMLEQATPGVVKRSRG
jgi:hypothetical protein